MGTTESRYQQALGRRRWFASAFRALGAVGVLGFLGRTLQRLGAGERTACVRPPGALVEDEFLARCIRCGRCADACPNQCIEAFTVETGRDSSMVPGAGQYGTPVIYPRKQACILCNGASGDALLCTEACPTGALEFVPKETGRIVGSVDMGRSIVDKNLCYSWNGSSCGVCIRACPLEGKALRAGLWEKPIVDPEWCVGCGLCERACVRYPQAIRVEPSNTPSEEVV